MNILLRILINALAVLLVAYILPNIEVASIYTALLVALVLGIINITLKPILFVLTLPITILTLGLFTFVLNALMFWLVGTIVKGFTVNGFLPALIGSLLFSVISVIANNLLNDRD